MDRRERDRYDYGSYEDYRDDAHYHSARNLTDEFERGYRAGRSHRDEDRDNRVRSYHEGDMGDAYERRSREENSFRSNSDSDYRQNNRNQQRSYPENMSRDRDRFSNYQDDYRSYQGMDRSDSMDNNRSLRGNVRRGYGISDYEGTSDRFNTLNSNQYSSGSRNNQSDYSGSREERSSRYGSSMGDSSIHSDRGIPNYSGSSFADDYGTMNSGYGSRNYNEGSGYSGSNRGGSYGNQNYGSSSGNYSGYGSRGSGSYGGRSGESSGRSNSPRNYNRDTND
jgi:hypothetical protein